jgi:hypothetical protein
MGKPIEGLFYFVGELNSESSNKIFGTKLFKLSDKEGGITKSCKSIDLPSGCKQDFNSQ